MVPDVRVRHRPLADEGDRARVRLCAVRPGLLQSVQRFCSHGRQRCPNVQHARPGGRAVRTV